MFAHEQAQSRDRCSAQAGAPVDTLLTQGKAYTDQGQADVGERYRERVVRQITQRAAKLALQGVLMEQAA